MRSQAIGVAAVFVIFVGLWQGVVQLFHVSPIIIPAPSAVAVALVHGVVYGAFWADIQTTVLETIFGFFIGSAVGIAIGMIVAEVPPVERLIYPYVVAFQAIPKLAIAPIIVIWLGFGIASKIAVVATIVFFPVAANTIEGLKSADPARVEMLSAFGANKWQIFRMLRLRSALPFLFAGLDVGVLLAVLGAVVAEWVGAKSGLGNLILKLTYTLDMGSMFAVLVILSLMGVLAHLIVQFFQRRVIFW